MADPASTYQNEDVKTCQHCGIKFDRPAGGDRYYFKRRRFCSNRCVGLASAKHEPLIDRLMARTQKHAKGCWLWVGGKTTAGYGHFSYRNTIIYAHRASYECHSGPIPAGMVICHRCDTPACINPEHLFLGTQADNIVDMHAKGRQGKRYSRPGENHPQAKLLDADVIAIRLDQGSSQSIAERFNISSTTVSDIRKRKTWRHI